MLLGAGFVGLPTRERHKQAPHDCGLKSSRESASNIFDKIVNSLYPPIHRKTCQNREETCCSRILKLSSDGCGLALATAIDIKYKCCSYLIVYVRGVGLVEMAVQ